MGGFIKGLAVGLGSFAAGFVVLALLFPPDPVSEPPEVQATGVPAIEATEAQTPATNDDEGTTEPASAPDVETPAVGQPEPQPSHEPGSVPVEAEPAPPAEEIAPALDVPASDAAPGSSVAPDAEPATQPPSITGEPAPSGGTTVEPAPAATPAAESPSTEPESTTPPALSAPVSLPAEAPDQSPAAGAAAVPEPLPAPAETPVAAEAEAEAVFTDIPDTFPAPAQTPPGAAPAVETVVDGMVAAETVANAAPETAPPLSIAETAPAESAPPAPASSAVERGQTDPGAQPSEPAAPLLNAGEPVPQDGDEAETLPALPPGARNPVVPLPPLPGLNRVVEGVTVGRLPSIGAAPAPSEPVSAVAPADDPDQPAWRRFAAVHDNPAGLPLFAVILIDAPADPGAEAAILGLPFAVSVALDPADPDAPRRAAAYRAAGHEVAILGAGLPAGATPADLDVTFDGWLRALPQAVALVDPPEGGFQGDRALAQRLMPLLDRLGLGLVTLERGLNPAAQVARGAGIADATVFRLLDAGGENAFTIRRYLDRATFRAQQDGTVAVMGLAARPETIDGILGWRFEGRADQVSLAPVSAWLQSR